MSKSPDWYPGENRARPHDPSRILRQQLRNGIFAEKNRGKPSTSPHAQNVERAALDMQCPTCNFPASSHPFSEDERSFDGFPYLRVLCTGQLVKL